MNTYAYVGGNPISNIDVNGLDVMSVIADRVAGIPNGSVSPVVPSTQAGLNFSFRAGVGPAVTVKYNSNTGFKYLGVGIGVGMSCSVTAGGLQGKTNGGASGLTTQVGGGLGTGFYGTSCNATLEATFNERSTFVALATGGAVWFAGFTVTNAAGYPQVAAAVASAVGILGVAVSAYRYAICLKVVA